VGVLVVAWAVAAAVIPAGLPPGVVFQGAVFGCLYALLAIGIVLVYRANRVVNFAQAEFGGVAAVLAIELVIHWHVPYFLAIAAGFVAALVTGALINLVVINRFRRAPRLILSVVTIGLAQILAGLATIIPLAIGKSKSFQAIQRFSTPFQATFHIRPVVFNGNYVVAVIAVVAIMAGLTAFFRWSDYGVAIRAAADNRERAGLLGIPVPRLNTLVWSLAALLSAVAVILRTPLVGFSSFSLVAGGGNALLLRTLAAAVIGKMENLPRTVVAAVGIGIFEWSAAWATHNTVLVDALLVAVILVALLAQRDLVRRSLETGIASFRAVREVRPVPRELAAVPEVVFGRLGVVVGALAVAIGLPFALPIGKQQLAALILIYAMVAVSLVVLTGWAGQISLGQFALVGLSGAAAGVLYQRHHWDFTYAALAGIGLAAMVSLAIGLPALRIRGPFLAVTTLAFAVSASTYFLSPRYFPWFVPPHVDRPVLWGRVALTSDLRLYYFSLVGLLFVLAAARSLRASRTGRAIVAVRENESAAETVSLSSVRLKLGAFVISGAIAGFAGVIYVVHQQGIFPTSFGADISVQLFSMVVIGGLGSLPGAVLGAVYVGGANYLLPAGWSLLATGAGILLLLMLLPEGLGGFAYALRDAFLVRVAKRRGIVVPSLLADAATERSGVLLSGAVLFGEAATTVDKIEDKEPVGVGPGR